MELEIKVPSLGEGIEGGDVQTIYVSVGDIIELEQGLLELETGKAAVDIPAPEAGKVTEIRVNEGDADPNGVRAHAHDRGRAGVAGGIARRAAQDELRTGDGRNA